MSFIAIHRRLCIFKVFTPAAHLAVCYLHRSRLGSTLIRCLFDSSNSQEVVTGKAHVRSLWVIFSNPRRFFSPLERGDLLLKDRVIQGPADLAPRGGSYWYLISGSPSSPGTYRDTTYWRSHHEIDSNWYMIYPVLTRILCILSNVQISNEPADHRR